MNEKDKKIIDKLRKTIDFNSTLYIDDLGDNDIKSILYLFDKQQKEIDILSNKILEIRNITKDNIICFDGENYRPVKNLTKQDVYKKFLDVNLAIKGNYVFLKDKDYLKELLEE